MILFIVQELLFMFFDDVSESYFILLIELQLLLFSIFIFSL